MNTHGSIVYKQSNKMKSLRKTGDRTIPSQIFVVHSSNVNSSAEKIKEELKEEESIRISGNSQFMKKNTLVNY